MNILFDGKQESHTQKYQTTLEQYKKHLLNETGKTSIKDLIQELNESKEADSELTQHLINCLKCLDSSGDPRKAYQDFVTHLDRASMIILNNPDQPNSQSSLLAKQLAYIRWSKVNLTSHFQERIQKATPTSQTSPQSFETLSASITSTNQQIKNASPSTRKSWLTLNYQKFRGTLGVENFTGNKNTPNRLATLTEANGRIVNYIRHGSPTMGKNATFTNASERIAPNYELFITAAREKGEGVFYAIHQRNFGDSHQLDDERGRTHAILALQGRHPNFHAIVQPVEGAFFEGPKENTTFDQLKTDLTKEFFEPSDNPTCVLPKACHTNPSYKEAFTQLVDTVRNVFFPDVTHFTPEMRQNFILIFYALQRMDLRTRLSNEQYPISYYVTACKDNLDRGGGQALLELALCLVMTGQENDAEQLNNLITNTLGPAIAVKQKEMLVSRLTPILKAIKHIQKNKDAIKTALDKANLPYKPTDVNLSSPLESGPTENPSSPSHDQNS